MQVKSKNSMLFSDTPVPDLFVAEYLPSASGEFIKVYIYCLFMAKHGKSIPPLDLSKKLGMELSLVKEALSYWENLGALSRKGEEIILSDLKEKEVNRLYRPKLTSSPEDARQAIERNQQRSQAISAINNAFFQGIMSPSWYIDIDAWFDKYGFEEDVMISLFKYCFDKHALHQKYVQAVAEAWHNKGIQDSLQLDAYYSVYEKCNEIKKLIRKKLGLTRNLTEYEAAYVEKWVLEFGYQFDIIELALKKTTSKTNPNFDYLNAIFAQWHENGLKTAQQVQENMKANKPKKTAAKDGKPMPYKNYKQRNYENFDKFYDNLKESS